jgi:hypothetical protein
MVAFLVTMISVHFFQGIPTQPTCQSFVVRSLQTLNFRSLMRNAWATQLIMQTTFAVAALPLTPELVRMPQSCKTNIVTRELDIHGRLTGSLMLSTVLAKSRPVTPYVFSSSVVQPRGLLLIVPDIRHFS